MEKGFFKKNKILGINLLYILSVLPLIIFGYYKNGILVSQKGSLSFFLSLQYLIIPIVIIILSYVFETYYYIVVKKEDNIKNVVNSIAPFVNVLCYLVCAPTDYLWISIPIIVILDILLKFINNRFSINQVALFRCLLYGIMMIIGHYSLSNYYEATLESSIVDPSLLFLGKGIGFIGTTSTLLAIVGYIVLLFNSYYKKDIPIVAFLGYAVVSIIVYFVGGLNFNELLINTFNSGLVFALVYVSSISVSTPVVNGGRFIYSILIGVLCAIMVNVLNFDIGIYFVILILSLLTPIFDKFKLSLGE